MMNAKISRDWVGRTVDGKFSLLAWLGGAGGSGIFLTERSGEPTGKAVIRLLPVEAAAGRTDGWIAAQGLNHPHLLRLYTYGNSQMDGVEFAYVVTEYAPEVLAEILTERALTPEETRGVLEPLVDALEYLHAHGLAHGHVKPSNIMANGDQLQLTTDHLLRADTASGEFAQGNYDAPERARGVASSAADIWSLGMTLVKMLTQKQAPTGADGEPLIPEGVPEPFAGIARACLRRDPAQRCSLQEIRTRLGLEVAGAKPVAVGRVAESPVAKPKMAVAAAAGNEKLLSVRAPWRRVGIAVVVLVILVFIAWYFRTEAGAKNPKNEAAPIAGQEQTPAQPARAQAMVQTKGAVAERVPPNVLRSALETIHGTVRVDVQVNVNSGGNVTGAAFADHGPSRYFADAAMKAARQWTFQPAQVDGRPVKSVWLLKFAFTRNGHSAAATEVSP